MGSMAYAPYQPPKNKLSSPGHHGDPQSPAGTSTTQDPYYSNEDIEILHEIVSIAQETLEDVSGARPLPAAALFKAYDEVLPKHGVDPDDENHLSRLIFRIGGEKGSGSLPEKFRAVLAGMGISLEYGDSSLVSQRASQPSHSSDDSNHQEIEYQKSPSVSPRPRGNFGEMVTAWPSVPGYGDESVEMGWKPADRFPPPDSHPKSVSKLNLTMKTVTSGPSLPQESQQNAQKRTVHSLAQPVASRTDVPAEGTLEFPDVEEEIPALRAALSQPPLLSMLDRWRTASKNGRVQRVSPPLLDSAMPPVLGAEGLVKTDTKSPSRQFSPRIDPFPTRQTGFSGEPNAKKPKVTKPLLHSSTTHHPATARGEEGVGCSDYTAMLNRAGRAREIYLASRAFNHWAERTAARLEKEAVARRHMIRFRCFRGWSNAPNSRSPAIDHLRATTAVQKLRRAVACQEEQLRAAASAIYESNCIQKARRAMGQWLCSTAQHGIRCETAYRAKRGIARSWNDLANIHNKHAELAAKSRQDNQKRHLIHRWAGKAQQAERQLAISKHVGLVRPMFAHLAAWWDRAEVEKRAEVYRANLVWKRAHSALDSWNLRARAQAFVWRSDYRSASCALNRWTQVVENASTQRSRAAFAIERYQVPATLSRVDHFVTNMSKLEYYAHRARLFIMASKFLRALDRAYEAKKASRKEEIRQQLRARYKEVSSARKKRQFHSALESWRSSARRHAFTAAEATEHVEKRKQTLRLHAIKTWVGAARQHQEQRAAGQKHAVYHVLRNWGELAGELSQRDTESWDMWMQRKQRQALKSWSISSLQGIGRAHTAAMVQQRHEADNRNRAFQLWRHSSQGMEDTDSRYTSATPYHSAFNGRRSWRTVSSRKPVVKLDARPQYLRALNKPATPLDTPTRWTGRPLAMPSTLAKPMPPVREADEQSATASSLSDEAEIAYDLAKNINSSQHGFHRSLVLRTGKIASTTPRAPIPTNLRRSIPVRNPAFHNSAISTVTEHSFQPRRSGTKQQETSEKKANKMPGYVDSAIQTGLSAIPGALSQGPPTSNWRGPATPSRNSTGTTTRGEAGGEVPPWTHMVKTAPQPSRLTGQERRT